MASRTFAASVTVRQWIPVLSTNTSEPIAPPSNPISALCGRINASELWLAGPRHEARDSSHSPHITRFVLTAPPEPELEPSDAARVVSYGFDGLPDHVLRWKPSVDTSTLSGLFFPPGLPARPLYSVRTDF